MKRFATRSLQTLIDIVVLASALFLAFIVRFEGDVPPQMWPRLVVQLPYVVAAQYALLVLFGVPRFSWRHIALRDVTRIFVAITSGFFVLGAIRYSGPLLFDSAHFQYVMLPWGVIAVDAFIAFLGIAGVRASRRLLGERVDSAHRRRQATSTLTRTLLVGAGQAGQLVAKEMYARPDLAMEPVGFVDDDPVKQKALVHGLPVLGTIEDLGRVALERGATQVLITIAAAPGAVIRRIRAAAEEHGLPTKIIPGVYEIVGGQVNMQRIRPVAIEDLLRREPVRLELETIEEALRGNAVMVTGAGGSIGSGLCRQIAHFAPGKLLLVERCENALFHIHRELIAAHPDVTVVPLIADITDESRIDSILAEHRPDAVFHAAAHKHVPMMEWNLTEAVKNNVFGTKCIADASDAHGVSKFVMVSTDKAVNPTSVMGTTKRIAEMYVQALGGRSDTEFLTVRFGNVLGSAGSVVPIFQEQIARGGPVCVTHPDMVRYFMTIPEACQLVLQAGVIGESGDILVLDMGEPVKIVDLARDLIRLSGFRPDQDIDVEFTGIRPGEKLFEELAVDEEHVSKTRHAKIFVGSAREGSWEQLNTQLNVLRQLLDESHSDVVGAHLKVLVPEYTPNRPTAPAIKTQGPAVAGIRVRQPSRI